MTAQTILPANTLSSGYDVDNSCRFNDGDSAYMHNTLSSSDGSDVKGTISFWTKRGALGANMAVICGKKGNTERVTIGFTTDDYFEIQFQDNSNAYYWRSSAVYRDVAAWYNFVIHLDTGNATANSRARVWVNNSEITSWGTRETCPQNLKIGFFNGTDGNKRLVGARGGSSVDKYYDGYIAEVVVLNNTLDAATNFGEYDEDSPTIWKPKDVSGLTFGTHGFYLDFEDSSNLGNDANGGTDFTEVNLAATDQSTDTCTNNFATLNPLLDVNAHPTYSEGNLKFAGTGSTNFAGATIPVSSGKWFVEVKCTTASGSYPIIGVIDSQSTMRRDGTYFVGSDASATNPSGFAVFTNADIYHNDDNNFSNLTTTYGNGDIIGLALNMDAATKTLGFYKNGTLEVTINLDAPPSDAYMFCSAIHSSTSGAVGEFNFGSPPFAISSGNADGDGYGNFEFSVPSGYYALNTKNLAEYG